MEELRNEKHELQEKLANVSVSMIPNLVDVSEDEISPDRLLISIPARERSMSLDQELGLLPERRGIFSHPMGSYLGELSLEDRSTSCSDLVPEVVELATQTEADEEISDRRIVTNMGTQTDEGLRNEDTHGLPETTSTSSTFVALNSREMSSQMVIILMLPQYSGSHHARYVNLRC
uniref:Uncharacterized protein n=1 Tax=Lygus hesperus TaxID=30085 RepID=A0A0K8TC59_LYGHE